MTDSRVLSTALLLGGGIALLLGLDAALLLLELPAPLRWSRLAEVHGMLLVLSFVGTLVALERAIALGRWWGLLAPAFLGAGGVVLISPAPRWLGGLSLVLGTAVLVASYLPLWRRQLALPVLVQAGGAVLAFGAALLWLGGVEVPALLPWLAGFLVLTIVGERMELARVAVRAARVEVTGVALCALAAAGALASLLWAGPGHALFGAALLGIAGWLARHDVARHTVRASGLVRFTATWLLAGYAWLAVAGAIWLLAPDWATGRTYDAVVHAVFLGFVMSMVFAHAPTILPAVLRRPLPYRPVLYLPAVLLHGSLLLRVLLGDLREQDWAWRAGGAGNIVAVLLFVVVAAASVLSSRANTTRAAVRRP